MPAKGYKLSEEAKKRISEANKAHHSNNPEKYKHSEETRKKIGESNVGKHVNNKYALGRHHTEEAKQKISKAHMGSKGYYHPDPTAEQIEEFRHNNTYGYELVLNGVSYKSIGQAAEHLGINYRKLCGILLHHQEQLSKYNLRLDYISERQLHSKKKAEVYKEEEE